MRIFHVITLSTLGGAQSVVVNLANNQVIENEVYVLFGGNGEAWINLDSRIKLIRISNLNRTVSLLDLFVLFKLFFFQLKYTPDIIHLHSSKIGVLGRLAFPSSKIIYTVHGFDSIRLMYRKFLPLERRLQYKCKNIVCVSKYDLKNLYNEGISHNVKYIYNGVPNYGAVNYDVQLSYDKIKYKRMVLCIARMDPPKRFDLFLLIAKLLPQYIFVWIGNSDVVENVPNNVLFLGSISDAFRYNIVADIFLLLSDFEGLPMTIIEAMSFGKPIISSNVGGISEIVINNENGFTINNNVNTFVEKIEYVLENKDVYDLFSLKSIELFNDFLGVDKMCAEYMKLYKA